MDDAPRLAAFAWTPISEKEIFILGGTDGSLLATELWRINFGDKKAEMINSESESICHGHLIFKDNKLLVFGGKNLDGTNYALDLSQGNGNQW